MPAGRPRKPIDWETFRKLCQIHCTLPEIAGILKVSEDTLQRACVRELKEDFAVAYKKESAQGKMSLRRLQWQSAQKGNVTMQIWLGKQLLGQRDHYETEIINKGDAPTIQVDTAKVEALVEEIKALRQLPPGRTIDSEKSK